MRSLSLRREVGRRTSPFRNIGSLLLLLAAIAVSAFPQASLDTSGAQELLSLINQERATHGAGPLVLNDQLTVAARKHSQKMAESDTLLHQFEDEPPLNVRISKENVRSDHEAENIALGGDLPGIHIHLMQSPPHRANILNPQFDSVGIGIVQEVDLLYVTEDFAHVLPVYSAMEADAAAQQVDLAKFACDMARDDKLDVGKAQAVAGARSGIAWTAPDLSQLPAGVKKTLSQPMLSGYALGVCFAPSATYPSGVYWLVMVIY
jgi:uncharacterized protein YkwD